MLLKGYLTVKEVAKQLSLSEYRVRERNVSMKIRHFINEFSVFPHRIFPV